MLRFNRSISSSFRLVLPQPPSALSPHSSPFDAPHFRKFGVLANARSYLANKRQKEAFSKQTTLMLSEPKWTFDVYLRAAREQRIAAGAYGWRLKLLPWLRNNPIVQQLDTHDRVVAAMLPSDRIDPANLGAEAKNKIAQRSGCTLQQVNAVIKQVMASRNMHGWMLRLKEAGRPIPQSHEDMEKIATQPDNLMTKAFTRRR